MFPLKSRKLIRGAEAHRKAGLSDATDYVASYVPLYAPFDGRIHIPYPIGGQGGRWLCLVRDNGDHIEFAHLDSNIPIRNVIAGEQIATTGNSGKLTTGPHLHVQIVDSKGRRLDPELYNWGSMNIVDLAKLNQIYQEILFRAPEAGADGYLGKTEDEVRREVGSSQERKTLIALIEAARGVL